MYFKKLSHTTYNTRCDSLPVSARLGHHQTLIETLKIYCAVSILSKVFGKGLMMA
jgi:hypothetical protein